MICCVVVWVLLDTCLMEFLLEMDFLSMTDGYSKRNCWDGTGSFLTRCHYDSRSFSLLAERGFEIREEFSRICKTRNGNHHEFMIYDLTFYCSSASC